MKWVFLQECMPLIIFIIVKPALFQEKLKVPNEGNITRTLLFREKLQVINYYELCWMNERDLSHLVFISLLHCLGTGITCSRPKSLRTLKVRYSTQAPHPDLLLSWYLDCLYAVLLELNFSQFAWEKNIHSGATKYQAFTCATAWFFNMCIRLSVCQWELV